MDTTRSIDGSFTFKVKHCIDIIGWCFLCDAYIYLPFVCFETVHSCDKRTDYHSLGSGVVFSFRKAIGHVAIVTAKAVACRASEFWAS